jgi:hypothetical protein
MSDRQASFAALEGKSPITAADVLAIRPILFGDMVVSPDEAESLFRINAAARDAAPEWRDLFVEAMTDYVVRQQEPQGYIDRAKADWLMARLGAGGRTPNAAELEMLVYVLERAESAPAELGLFAMRQVARHALSPERLGGQGPALTAEEVSLLRRALYAFAGAGGAAAVSREEAEILFDLNDASRGRPNDPAWTDLFAKAIGSAIMAAAGYAAPSREEALRREAWLNAPPERAVDTVGRAFTALLGADALSALDPESPGDEVFVDAQRDRESAIFTAAPVTAEEAGWMLDRIGRDGVLDGNEKALLEFVKDNADSVPPEVLQKLAAA